MIHENYTTSLFDDNWILVNFEAIHKEFAEKVEQATMLLAEAYQIIGSISCDRFKNKEKPINPFPK